MTRKRQRIICVVEGDGERSAVPTIIDRMLARLRRGRRIFADPERILCAHNGDRITQPFDAKRQLGIEYYVARAVRERPAAVVVIVDAEERCVARTAAREPPLGPELLGRARAVAGDIPVAVVVANRMFEAWFLADFHSFRSRGVLPAGARFQHWRTPEAVGGCKGWLEAALGVKYRETVDQGRLAAAVSLPLRRHMRARAPSFRKLYCEIERISRSRARAQRGGA
ncbi:MAG: DUF4276 family protein [Polyangiaceae bacterium]|nr:DUF4276 family protein [Polyangiaceae bacterium]